MTTTTTAEAQDRLPMVRWAGGALIMAMFALVNVPRVTLAVAGDDLANSPALAETLWRSHLATFGYTGAALGLALLGLSIAAVRAALVPRWFVVAGPIGAAALITMSLLVNAVAAGSPLMFIGVAGFGVWIVFLATFGVRLWLER